MYSVCVSERCKRVPCAKGCGVHGLGYDGIICKVDQQPVLVKITEKVRDTRAEPVIARGSKKHSHQEQGQLEVKCLAKQ